jgi:RNA polymerase sigma-70 factor (sigma-E family)
MTRIDLPQAPPPASAVRVGSFEDFVHSTGPRLMRTAVLLTGETDAAQDLLQSTYAAVFAKWRMVSRADHPLAYARTMMTRVHLSEKRRKRVVELHVERDAPAPAVSSDLRLTLLEALATLTPMDRAVLVLRFWEDLSIVETADQLGITQSACRTRSSRALARLRTQYPLLADNED